MITIQPWAGYQAVAGDHYLLTYYKDPTAPPDNYKEFGYVLASHLPEAIDVLHVNFNPTPRMGVPAGAIQAEIQTKESVLLGAAIPNYINVDGNNGFVSVVLVEKEDTQGIEDSATAQEFRNPNLTTTGAQAIGGAKNAVGSVTSGIKDILGQAGWLVSVAVLLAVGIFAYRVAR